MTKFIIIFLILFLPVVELTAEEPIFRNFNIEKINKQYFIVKPKNYDILLKSRNIDTLVPIGLKYYEQADDMIANSRQYVDWKDNMVKKIVPQETYRIIQELMNTDTLHANISYNILYMDVLIDREGNYLNVSFKMSDQLIKRLTEEQLQQIHDAFIVAKKVDLAVMEITNMGSYYTQTQDNKMFEYMREHARELMHKGLYTPLKVFEILDIKPIKLDYGLLEFKVGDTREAYKYRENLKNHN